MTASYHSQVPAAAPPPPPRVVIEQSLEQVLQSLLELGICASDVQETALESSNGQPGGLIGRKTVQLVESLSNLHSIRSPGGDGLMIPLEVINQVDQGRNPHLFTKDFIERLAGENMYTNGILSAVSDYRDLLVESMKDAFPDLKDYLENQQLPEQRASSSSTATGRSLPATTPTSVLINGGNDPSSSSMNGQSQLPPQGPPHGGIQNGMTTTVENGRGEEDVKMEQDFR
ncbi:hypothetical protein JCM5350_007585 [Sporobolomyces pararoseus]